MRATWLALTRGFRTTFTANICGHRTKMEAEVTHKGETYVISLRASDNGRPDYCHECLTNMTIRCAWCGNSIRVGDPVTLYMPRETFVVPPHAVRYDEDTRCLVGCLRWNCGASGIDRMGFWVPPGKVERVPSPYEMLLGEENRGKTLIISDLSDPTDLGKFV